MPVDTFDAWISKQVRASKRGAPEKPETSSESTKLPESTFDAWMKKQKPKEMPSRPQSTGSPDTFQLWIDKRVAEWKDAPEKVEATEEIHVTASASE